ncbi:MAG: exonuclease SbcCD subunit D [Lachnospiraceae bacterium]|nr:exonuclease SbcCD subunit D [Lachnospiraceae bacterium]
MKILHLADLHLGRSLADFDLIDDQRYILNQILDVIKEKEVNAVVIAGDVYDKSIPSEAATNLLDSFLNDLAKINVNVLMISGNHDSDDRLNFGSSLFKANNIYISAIYKGELYKKTLSDEYGDINFYLLPFVKASQVKRYYPDAKIENYNDAVMTVIDNANIDDSARNIILSHQFVAGGSSDPTLSGSESVQVMSVGLVEKISYKCFDKFDYAALGHIHSAQDIGREYVSYSGSPLKYSLSEANSKKVLPIITFKNKGEISREFVELKPMRDLRHIKGKMKDLLSLDNVTDTDDFIYASLTDEDYIENAISIFRATYPNTVKIDYDNSKSKAIEEVDISAIVESKTYQEFISDFYHQIYGTDITDEEMQIMIEVAKEAGVDI